MVEVAESRALKAFLQEKEEGITNLQTELTQTRLPFTHVLTHETDSLKFSGFCGNG